MWLVIGLIIPLLGTGLGAFLVFFMKKELNEKLRKILLGFAGGVMLAASVWSLIDPSIRLSADMGKWAFVPAAVGLAIGVLFLLFLDMIIPHIHKQNEEEGPKNNFKKITKMIFAVTLHNIPEGMAVGVVFAGAIYGNEVMTISAALALSIGIAIQNFPEGAIISMPLYQEGMTKTKSFLLGLLSGAVEPVAALITIAFVGIIEPALPYFLAFAAGAMIYAVVEEVIPEAQEGRHSNLATISLAVGFILMMCLDIAFG